MLVRRSHLLISLSQLYTSLALLTIVLLIFFSLTTPRLATTDAWIHAFIVVVFAAILPIRARAALAGKQDALRATGIIASVLCIVNVVEAVLPHFMPVWMRVDMFVIAAVLAAIIYRVISIALKGKHGAVS